MVYHASSDTYTKTKGSFLTPSGRIYHLSSLVLKKKTGYPTQKPLALLERIIKASSNPGDVVFDPFCGCATTLVAADRLQRSWVGIDISPRAAEFQEIIARDDYSQVARLT